jgi:hypothetical protein
VLATACFVMWLMHGTQLHVLKLHVRNLVMTTSTMEVK